MRVTTPHFVVYSDLPRGRTEEHARQLEWMLHGVLETGWDYHGTLPFKLNVVLLSNPSDADDLIPPGHDGYFQANVMAEPWAIMRAPWRRLHLALLLHELSHHLAYLVLPYQPVWFSEGLAGYNETARWQDDVFVLGAPNLDHVRYLSSNGIMSSAQLFTFRSSPTPNVYASSWLAVHYLMSRHADAFVRYQDELARGQTHAGAWRSAFPWLSEQQLDEQLAEYLAVGEFLMLEEPLQRPPVPLATTQLRAADEEALRAELWWSCRRCTKDEQRSRARASVERALTLDPKQTEARLMRSALFSEESGIEQKFRELTRDAPRDYRAWLALALLSRGDESRAALAQALALAPQQAWCWAVAAEQASQRGELDAALVSAQRALRLQPTNLRLLLLNAEILAQLRHCPELRRIVERVEGFDEQRSSEAQRRRARELSAGCTTR